MPVHEVADSGFDREAASYERARPSYPPDCVAWFADQLGIGPGRTVLDLAAGTGKFTRLLEPFGAHLVAAEPVDGMRAVLARTSPSVPMLSCAAEFLLSYLFMCYSFYNIGSCNEHVGSIARHENKICQCWGINCAACAWSHNC